MADPSKLPLVQWGLLIMQGATLVALIVYVWKTWQMAAATRQAAEASTSTVNEMREARREASAPRLAIYFASPSTSISEIVVENFGESTATNVTFEFIPPLASSEKSDLGVLFFQTPKTLPPHSRFRHAFDTWPEYFGANLPKRYDVTIRFQRLGEPQVREETHVLDAGSFEHYATWHILGVHELAGRFKQFADRVERLLQELRADGRSGAKRYDLIADARSLNDALSDLRATLELLEKASTDQSVAMFPNVSLPALRRHALAALLASYRERASETLREALSEVLLALYHRDWELLSKKEAAGRLEAAAGRLLPVLPPSEPPAV